VFNLTNSANIKRPEVTNLVFNFDGTVQSGHGDPRQLQPARQVLMFRVNGAWRQRIDTEERSSGAL
jgi:hypothetical protein